MNHSLNNKKLMLRNLLRKFREEAGLRQIELAAQLRRPQSFVSKYESGEKNLTFLEVLEVCNALKITVDDLISGLKEEPNCDSR